MTGQVMPPLLTEQAGTASRNWTVFGAVAIGVLVLVVVLLAYVVLRFRRRDEQMPAQTHYRVGIEVLYTVVPLLVVGALLALALVSLRSMTSTAGSPDLTVEVLGSQWQWRFTYPDDDVVVSGAGEEPPELVLPAGATVRFELASADVIHSFWVPGFLFKRDLVPGSPTSFDVDVVDRPGSFRTGVCAEYCGLYHDRMQFAVRVVPADEFGSWVQGHREGGR